MEPAQIIARLTSDGGLPRHRRGAAGSLGVTNGQFPIQNVIFFFIPDVVLGRGEAMRRREFITVLVGTAVSWPLAARAQQSGKLPTIGYLGASTPADAEQWTSAFVGRLHELGWIEGRTVAIEYRWGEARAERYAELTAEFVRLKVDVIATYGTPTAVTAKRVTSAIPIVFALAADPIGSGLVTSLARPGGNVTGMSTQHADFPGKRLALLREVVPGLHRLAVLANAGNSASVREMGEVQEMAQTLGLEFVASEIRKAEDIAPALDALKGGVDAIYLPPDALTDANRVLINGAALSARLPTMYAYREYVQAGGLMSYGPNYPDLFRRSADMVDKILRGTKPSEIPVEQPTKFDFVINLKTAKALGLEIPQPLLITADEVIE
jgi:putative tryptophan/tyrosine transport system substrate-binding protein